ncbi:MAG: RNA polymerase sigma factor RpoD/SigA [Treponema sp.]|nr:RNA polymerase sigma factor RpoD/SigA [Treponema sp.]
MTDLNPLSMYMKEIGKIPLLTYEQECELAKKAAAGDKASRTKLVNSNLRFVINVAKKYQNNGLEFEDLVSEGNVGLLTAIDHFDVNKGYHFISYAVWWIRQSILKAIGEKGRAIRVPLNRANEIAAISKARSTITENMSEEQELTEVANMLNMDVQHVREMVLISKEMASLDAEVSGKGNGNVSLGELLEDTNSPQPEEIAMNEELKSEVNNILDTLKPNESKVIKMRYGIGIEKPMSLKEVGDVCNLTKERIRQIENGALARMRHPVRANRLKVFVA